MFDWHGHNHVPQKITKAKEEIHILPIDFSITFELKSSEIPTVYGWHTLAWNEARVGHGSWSTNSFRILATVSSENKNYERNQRLTVLSFFHLCKRPKMPEVTDSSSSDGGCRGKSTSIELNKHL